MYEIKTTRLELEDGNYADFFQELRHGTQKAVNTLTRPFLKYPGGKTPKLTLKDGDEKPKVEGATVVEVDMAKVDWDAVNDSIIVGQVKEWSFGPVNNETLDNLPATIRAKLKNECDRLYGAQGPLQRGGGGN